MKKSRILLFTTFTLLSIALFGQASDWIVGLPNPDMEITDAQFFNKTAGWAVGNFYGSFLDTIPKNYIVKTTDEGETWEVKFSTSTTTEWLNGIAFPSPENGYAIGQNGLYYRSTDGGETWTAEDIGVDNDLLSIQFLNVHDGYISCSDGKILKTTNGGDFWFNSNFSNENDIHKVEFLNEIFGVCVGSNGLITKTENAGLVWEILDANTNVNLHNIQIIDENRMLICGDGNTILQTTDGGQTWTSSQVNNGVVNFADAQMIEGDYGLATGINQAFVPELMIYHTLDGGQTWDIDTLIQIFPDIEPTMSEIHFLSEEATIYMTGGLISYGVGFMVLIKADYEKLPTPTIDLFPKTPSIAIFPNPVIDQIQFQIPPFLAHSFLEIYDAKGVLILNNEIKNTAENEVLNIADFPKGSYFLKIKSIENKALYQGTFIKN